MSINFFSGTSEVPSYPNKKKDTSISFGCMREGHYHRFLYRDVEFEEGETKPKLLIIKEEHPVLWEHMENLEQLDLQIEWVKHIILRLWFYSVTDRFNIEFYSNNSLDSVETAWDISIFNLSSEEVIELIKSKITEVQKQND